MYKAFQYTSVTVAGIGLLLVILDAFIDTGSEYPFTPIPSDNNPDPSPVTTAFGNLSIAGAVVAVVGTGASIGFQFPYRKYRNQQYILEEKIRNLQEWEEILIGVSLVKNCSPRSADLIAGMGERMNNYIIARYLESTGTPAVYIDAREIIKTDDNYGAANVLFDVSVPLIRSRIAAVKGIPVVTGFISSTINGISTTLGRNGSDYTAGILGHALDASRIEIWTDVDGVMSADPRIVEKALVIPEISSFEAMELSYLGAQVIHPSTMAPALEKGIPIFIKNTMNPTAAGTKIVCTPVLHETPITGIAVMNDICLINIEGSGMIGKPGIAAEVFSALAKRKINVIMISQCSSEHSICFACSRKEAADAADALKCDLAKYLEQRIISGIQTTADCVTVAVIGENMIGSPGIAGKIFSALGDASVNVLAIAQGSSERNVSAIISAADKEAAVKAVHKKFFGV